MDFCFDNVNGVKLIDVQRDGIAGEGLDEDLKVVAVVAESWSLSGCFFGVVYVGVVVVVVVVVEWCGG